MNRKYLTRQFHPKINNHIPPVVMGFFADSDRAHQFSSRQKNSDLEVILDMFGVHVQAVASFNEAGGRPGLKRLAHRPAGLAVMPFVEFPLMDRPHRT